MIDLNPTILASPLDTRRKTDGPTKAYLELFYQGKEICFSQDDLPKLLGREPKLCDVVIKSDLASRRHCALVFQDGHIGLLDRSTNGTFIRIGRADPVAVKKSFYPLAGGGYIKLGCKFRENVDDDPEIIFYRIVHRSEG